MQRFGGCFPLLFALSCAAGSRDVLDDNTHDVRADAAASNAGAYAYVAHAPFVAVGLSGAQGLTDDETHHAVDLVAAKASACFKKIENLGAGAARINLPIDEGGVTGTPDLTFSPVAAAIQGMVCVLAPFRVSTFSPASGKSARSITIEAAWGSDVH